MQLFDLLYEKNLTAETSALTALSHKYKGTWKSYTYNEYFTFAQKLSWALLCMGVSKGVNIGSMIASNRAEWNFLDMALLQIGAVHVSLFATFDRKDLVNMLNQSEIKYLFTGSKAIARSIKELLPELPFLIDIICFDDTGGEFCHWEDLIKDVVIDNIKREELTRLCNSVEPEDVIAILYTSGTGGNPNGVVYYNAQLLQMVQFFTAEMLEINAGDHVLSFLPLNHAYERYHSYFYLHLGASVYYAENSVGLFENLAAVKPVVFNGVPLILERLFDAIRLHIETLPVAEQAAALQAFKHALTYDHLSANHYFLDEFTKVNEQKYYTAWRGLLGGKVRHIGVSGAKLPVTIARFFWGIGIPVFEVYGLTETSFVTLTHTKLGAKFGTVGRPIPFTEVRICEDGEIICKGPCMMLGYYKNKALNDLVFDKDGWYHTKDLGFMDEDGFVTIRGRKNNFFKLASGKFINPEEIEKMLMQSSFFANVMVTINDSNEMVAILCLNGNTDEKEIKKDIDTFYNALVMDIERIHKWIVVPNTWTPETGELTPLMKLKRNVLRNRYNEQIS